MKEAKALFATGANRIVPTNGTIVPTPSSREANHPRGEIDDEAFLRSRSSRHDRSGSPGSCTRQADGEGKDGQTPGASPPLACASPLSSPHDEEANDGQANDGQEDVRRMAP